MAEISKTIQIIFEADDKLSSSLSSINDSIGSVDSSFGGLGGRALKLAESLAVLGLAATAIATTFATLAAKSAAEYETALLDLQKVMDDSEGSATQYSKTFLKMAIDYGKSTTEIIQGVANFKQAGFDVVESLQLQTDALNLSIAGDIAAGESSEYLISILKGFKAPATDAAEVVDILNEVSNKYATDVRQLAIGMATLSPIANTMGFSFAETAGILTPVIEVFRSGGEAAVALQTGLLKLLDNSMETELALKKLGVSQLDVNGHMKSGKDILLEVSKAFKTLETNDKLYVATQLTGIHQAGKMVEVFDGLNKSIEITAVGMGSAGSAMKEVEIRMESAKFKMQQLQSAWDAFLTVAGSSILAELKPILDEITTVFTSPEGVATAKALGEAISNWIRSIVEFLGKLQEVYSEMTGIKDTSMLVDFAKWSGDIGTIKDTLIIANTTIQGLAMSVALVHDGLAAAGNIINGFANIILTAIYQPFVLVEEVMLGILEGLNKIPGIDLSASIKLFKKDIAEGKTAIDGFVNDTVPFEYWSDNVAKSILVVDEAINRLGEDGGKTGGLIKDGGDKAKGSMEDLAKAVTGGKGPLDDLLKSLDPLALAFNNVYVNTYALTQETKSGYEALKSYKGIAEDGSIVFNDNSAALAKVTTATTTKSDADKKAAEALSKNVDALAKYKLGLEEIQSKERVSIFEIQTKVDLAAIASQSEKFKEMFTSIDSGVKDTGDVITKLFGMMSEVSTTPFGMQALMAEIEKEQALRQQEFDLQKKLIEAQIEYMALKAQAMRNGDALISISADGLQPEIEAFMWQILKRIQTRANASGAEYLLGI